MKPPRTKPASVAQNSETMMRYKIWAGGPDLSVQDTGYPHPDWLRHQGANKSGGYETATTIQAFCLNSSYPNEGKALIEVTYFTRVRV